MKQNYPGIPVTFCGLFFVPWILLALLFASMAARPPILESAFLRELFGIEPRWSNFYEALFTQLRLFWGGVILGLPLSIFLFSRNQRRFNFSWRLYITFAIATGFFANAFDCLLAYPLTPFLALTYAAFRGILWFIISLCVIGFVQAVRRLTR